MSYILVGVVDCYIMSSNHGNFCPQALLIRQEDVQSVVDMINPHTDNDHMIKLNNTMTGSYFIDGIPMPPNIGKAVKYINQLVTELSGNYRRDYLLTHQKQQPWLAETVSLTHLNVHDRRFIEFFDDLRKIDETATYKISQKLFIMYIHNFS